MPWEPDRGEDTEQYSARIPWEPCQSNTAPGGLHCGSKFAQELKALIEQSVNSVVQQAITQIGVLLEDCVGTLYISQKEIAKEVGALRKDIIPQVGDSTTQVVNETPRIESEDMKGSKKQHKKRHQRSKQCRDKTAKGQSDPLQLCGTWYPMQADELERDSRKMHLELQKPSQVITRGGNPCEGLKLQGTAAVPAGGAIEPIQAWDVVAERDLDNYTKSILAKIPKADVTIEKIVERLMQLAAATMTDRSEIHYRLPLSLVIGIHGNLTIDIKKKTMSRKSI